MTTLDRRHFLRACMRAGLGASVGAGALELLATGGLAGSALLSVDTAEAATGVQTIKFACVAPEGSLWVNLTRDWDRELRSLSQNRVRIQIFGGGVLGEEQDAIRKMRAGQIQATGVTGIGMGEMVASTRALELPRLFYSLKELDDAVTALDGYYHQAFDEKGYVLLGFTEVGPIHLFTRKPIHKVSELNSMRMWVWEGDPVSKEIASTFGVSAVPLSLLNVLTSLQTKVIDGVYGSPLATVTMQWHNYLKYMTAEPLAYAVGVIAMDKKAFLSLPADVQPLMVSLGRKYTRQMVERARVDNDKAVTLMKGADIQVNPLDPSEIPLFNRKSTEIWAHLTGKLYSEDLLKQLQAVVQKSRSATGSRP